MMVYSKREIEEQLKCLNNLVDTLPLTEWEKKFLASVTTQTYRRTEIQNDTISKLYFRFINW